MVGGTGTGIGGDWLVTGGAAAGEAVDAGRGATGGLVSFASERGSAEGVDTGAGGDTGATATVCGGATVGADVG